MGRKVFGIGMYKTGLRSLARALQTLGFNTSAQYIQHIPDLAPYFDLDTAKFDPFHDDIRSRLERHDSFVDAPWLYLYRELDEWCPGSKFIMTLRRDAQSVADSDLSMWKRNGLCQRWLARHGTEVTADMFTDRYRQHNDNVRRYFEGRPDDLLTICFETEEAPWQRLCGFLDNSSIPETPFPWENRDPARSEP